MNASISTILFDIGNVIASDYWEAMWLTKGYGLADQLGLPPKDVVPIGRQLWGRYATMISSENDYWLEFQRVLGISLDEGAIEATEVATIKANPYVASLIGACQSRNVKLGLISNNTSFWYLKQLAKAQVALSDFQSDLTYVSCFFGVEKGAGESDLFSMAAKDLNASSTLVIDDRPNNIRRADLLGFRTCDYSRGISSELDGDGYYQVPEFTPFPTEIL